MKVIRSQHVSAEAPTFRKALAEHVHGAGSDLVDRTDVPAEMVMAGRVRSRESNHVMIAAVDAMQKAILSPEWSDSRRPSTRV